MNWLQRWVPLKVFLETVSFANCLRCFSFKLLPSTFSQIKHFSFRQDVQATVRCRGISASHSSSRAPCQPTVTFHSRTWQCLHQISFCYKHPHLAQPHPSLPFSIPGNHCSLALRFISARVLYIWNDMVCNHVNQPFSYKARPSKNCCQLQYLQHVDFCY